MASDRMPHTPLPWARERGFITSDKGEVIGAFANPDDSAYAVKAANMHERLVQAVKDLATADIINTEYIAALLKEADE